MKKKKNKNLKERLKTAKNPLAGVKTRDLIITLAVLLICFLSGFFGGYACNTSCKRVEASADTYEVREVVIYTEIDQHPTLLKFNIPSQISTYDDFFPLNFSFPTSESIPFSTYVSNLAATDSWSLLNRISSDRNGRDFNFDYYYYDADHIDWIDNSTDAHLSFSTGVSGDFESLIVSSAGLVFNYTNGQITLRLGYGSRFNSSQMFGLGVGQYYNYAYFFTNDIDRAYSLGEKVGFDAGVKKGTEEGIEIGKELGYDDGFRDGADEGDQVGYERGKAEGEDIGYQRGINERLEDITPWQHIVSAVNNFLNIQILPNVRISLVLSVSFGLILLGFAIKIFLGG